MQTASFLHTANNRTQQLELKKTSNLKKAEKKPWQNWKDKHMKMTKIMKTDHCPSQNCPERNSYTILGPCQLPKSNCRFGTVVCSLRQQTQLCLRCFLCFGMQNTHFFPLNCMSGVFCECRSRASPVLLHTFNYQNK